jgi:hypothetical protein
MSTTQLKVDLDPMSPNTPARTAALAETAAAALRAMSHATMPGEPGLGWPTTPFEVIDAMTGSATSAAQVYRQLPDMLDQLQADGMLAARTWGAPGPDPAAAVAAARPHLAEASELAAASAAALMKARDALVGVEPVNPAPTQDKD